METLSEESPCIIFLDWNDEFEMNQIFEKKSFFHDFIRKYNLFIRLG